MNLFLYFFENKYRKKRNKLIITLMQCSHVESHPYSYFNRDRTNYYLNGCLHIFTERKKERESSMIQSHFDLY